MNVTVVRPTLEPERNGSDKMGAHQSAMLEEMQRSSNCPFIPLDPRCSLLVRSRRDDARVHAPLALTQVW